MRHFPTEPIDVLFAAYGGGHVAMLRPVAQALPVGLRYGFLALTTAQADLERNGLDYFGYAELEGAGDPQVQAWGTELAGPENANAPVPHWESVAYHGLNFSDLVRERGEPGARAHYRVHGRHGFLPVQTMQRLLKKLRPKVVVATSAPRTERALLEAARELGIPSVCAVDLFALQEVEWISQPGYATRICVLNLQVADFLISQGCAPASVVVTGNPAFDTVSAPQSREAGRLLRSRRGFGPGDTVILWASNVEPERHPFTGAKGDPSLPRRIEAELRRLVAQDSRLKLVVRYHPSEQVDFAPMPGVTLSPREENLHALLNAVDIVVVQASTVGLEAHLAGRPVISVDSSMFSADAPFSRMGISTGARDVDALSSTISAVMERQAKAGAHIGPGHTATQSMVEEILALVRAGA